MNMHDDIERALYYEAAIQSRLQELAETITRDYHDKDLTIISILNGSLIFLADLIRRIPLPLHIDSLRVSSYHDTQSTGEVQFRQSDLPVIQDRDVLLLDDILDTGLTMSAVATRLQDVGARSVKLCVLLDKAIGQAKPIQADYVGFIIPKEFVVGYGLDYNERYRNLPFIGVLKPEAIERGARS